MDFLVRNYADHFHNSAVTIESSLTLGREFHETRSHCIDRVILAEADACAREILGSMLTDDDVTGFGGLPLRELYAKIFRL